MEFEKEEYRKDAERYRIASAGVAVSGFCVARLNSNGEVELMGCDVADEAIDQAMKGGEL